MARRIQSIRPSSTPPRGVQLPADTSASALLHQLLRDAAAAFPALRDAGVPDDPARFRTRYAETLVRFEAARVASAARSEIAASVADRAHARLRYVGEDGGDEPLAAHLGTPGAPLATTRVALSGAAGLRPRIAYGGTEFAGDALRTLGEDLARRGLASRGAVEALAAIGARGTIDLRGRRFVVFGAHAELSPVRLLLEGGADVLWLDVRPPPAELLASRALAGSITYAPDGADLLAAPRAVLATAQRFAAGEPVDFVLAAYAPGGGREWRLEGAMNALVRAVEPAQVRGVGLFISPTTPAVMQPGEVAEAARRWSHGPLWQRALARVGALPRGPHAQGEVRVARALVPLQGVSYQAAQYVEKILAAERFAVRGTRDGAAPPRVSANVAPITATRSLEHPLFQAGFQGAVHFGMEVFAPDTTRALNGLLLLHDLERAPDRDAPALFARQVHGGAYPMPYALDESIRVAAVLGMVRRPSLALAMLRRR